MTRMSIRLALAIWILPAAGNAQVMIDMSRITCEQYLALPQNQACDSSARMSGWFNQKTGYVWVDLVAYQRNVANVKSWCVSNPSETVMSALQRSTGTK